MTINQLHTEHERRFAANKFVYPVLSRRSNGISVGVNLNPDKVCNFDCIYCQVDRRSAAETKFVELKQLVEELGDVRQCDLFDVQRAATAFKKREWVHRRVSSSVPGLSFGVIGPGGCGGAVCVPRFWRSKDRSPGLPGRYNGPRCPHAARK